MENQPGNPLRDPSLSGLEEIFETYPQMQNSTSSMWFFFLLFPKQGDAYGPKQMMYTFASKMGKAYGVNGKWQKGMQKTQYLDGIREFMTTAVGWFFDGHKVHEDIVHQPVKASVSKEGWVKAWETTASGEKHGGEIIVVSKDPPELQVHFHGENGEASFKVWAESDWEMATPNNHDIYNRWYNSLLVSWRRFSFSGKFTYNGVKEDHDGYGYFQRVCLNIPMLPWFWPILVFEDGSVFSSFQPYLGLNNFRKHNRVLNPILKRIRLDVATTAYYADAKEQEIIQFTESHVEAIEEDGMVLIQIMSSNPETGDYMRIQAKSLAETGFDLEKYYALDFLHSLHNYNEHIVQVVGLDGSINGKKLDLNSVGKIFGNVEYCWGMSI